MIKIYWKSGMNYWAVDADGVAYQYEEEPILCVESGIWKKRRDESGGDFDGEYDIQDWADSLINRADTDVFNEDSIDLIRELAIIKSELTTLHGMFGDLLANTIAISRHEQMLQDMNTKIDVLTDSLKLVKSDLKRANKRIMLFQD